MIELDADQKTPLYEQLYAALADEIRTGQRAPGTPLPGRRTMAAQQGVSVNTVDAAYQMLAAEGLAEPRPRSGFYVQKTYGMLHSRARRAPAAPAPQPPAAPQPVYDLSTGSVDTALFPAGIEYLLGCLAHLFSDGMAAIENPGYFRTRTVLQNSGIPCTLVDIDREGLPADAMEKSGANLCYLTPSHHFPTGVTMPATRRAQLLAWAAARPGRYILEDDYDSEFRFDTRPLPSLQGMAGPDGPVVYLTTFSKSLAPGIRIACMVLPQSLLARYRRDFATYANTVSRFEQQTLCEFMAGGYFTRHLARMRLAYKRRMEAFAAALRAALPGVELDGVHSGLHFLLTLPGAGGERAMVAAAAQQGVRLRGLSEYYLARPELCRADTVVAGYSALKEDDVEKVAQALARAWLS